MMAMAMTSIDGDDDDHEDAYGLQTGLRTWDDDDDDLSLIHI